MSAFFSITVDVRVLLVRSDSGRTLFMARRVASAWRPGLWEFPGGPVKFGEYLNNAGWQYMTDQHGTSIIMRTGCQPMRPTEQIAAVDGGPYSHVVSHPFIVTEFTGDPVNLMPDKIFAEIGYGCTAEQLAAMMNTDYTTRNILERLAAEHPDLVSN